VPTPRRTSSNKEQEDLQNGRKPQGNALIPEVIQETGQEIEQRVVPRARTGAQDGIGRIAVDIALPFPVKECSCFVVRTFLENSPPVHPAVGRARPAPEWVHGLVFLRFCAVNTLFAGLWDDRVKPQASSRVSIDQTDVVCQTARASVGWMRGFQRSLR